MSSYVGDSLSKQSLSVLKHHKKLLIFMLCSTICTVAALTFILIPLFHIEDLALQRSSQVTTTTLWLAFGLILLLFFALNMILLLFCTGLVSCALALFKTNTFSVLQGFKTLLRLSGRIYAWQAIGNTYGTWLKCMLYWVDDFDQSPTATTLLNRLPWNVAIQFMLPVIIETSLNTKDAIQRSAEIIKTTWNITADKTLKSQLQPGPKVTYARAGLFVLLVLTVLLSGTPIGILGITIITLCCAFILLLTAITLSVQMLNIAAAYLFAQGVDTSTYYDQNLLKNAFREIKRKKFDETS